MSNAPPPHDLTPSLFHSWAPFWELEGGGSPGVGWGGGLWPGKGAPRPAAQTPWHVIRSCQDSGDGRPARGPGPAQLQGIWRSRTNAIRPFPESVLARGAQGSA